MLRNLFVFAALLTISTAVFAQEVFKVPSEGQLKRVIVGVPNGGGYLGIQPKEITKENYADFGLNDVRGVAITKVVEKSPAAQAGLQENDVIVRFNGTQVTSTRGLLRLISEVAPDHQATLTVLRGGSERDITVAVGKRETPFAGNVFSLENLPDFPNVPNLSRVPMPPGGMTLPKLEGDSGKGYLYFFGANRQIGVSVTPLTKQLGDYFGVTDGKGLLINNVSENSPAASADLRAGDILTAVDDKEVNEIPDLIKAVNEKKEGVITITFLRNKVQQTVTLEPKKSETNFPQSGDVQTLLREYQKDSK